MKLRIILSVTLLLVFHAIARAQWVFHPGQPSIIRLTTTNDVLFVNGYPLLSVALKSNAWNFNWATNGMAAGDFRTVNSNGAQKVTLYMSNGYAHTVSAVP